MPNYNSYAFVHLKFILLFFVALTISSCQDDIITTDTNKTIQFSTDTLSFDTVFTSYGSTTEKIMLYNRNNKAINISSITLAKGNNSMFRLNVDGAVSSKNTFNDILISARDSMFVFVEVTVNPNNPDAVLILEDSIVFMINGNKKNIFLEAIGQDIILFDNKTILNDTILTDKKPYLIYGNLTVDSAKTLTLQPGCKMYFHNNANLIVEGNLMAEGTFEKPISLRGDRLGDLKFQDPVPYNYIAGQWGGVYLLWKNGKHSLKHVNINSAYIGLYLRNDDRANLPDLEIANCRLHNFVYYGLAVQNGNVKVSNSEISNTGSYSVYLSGGKHEFLQSTIANYYNANRFEPTSRDKSPALMIMSLGRTARMETTFKNCIITGGLKNEISIVSRFLDQIKTNFDHNFIRREEKYDLSQFKNSIWYEKKDSIIFVSQRYDNEKNLYFNFMPDSTSSVRGKADIDIASQFPLDLNGNNRLADGEPDLGAYEWTSASQKQSFK